MLWLIAFLLAVNIGLQVRGFTKLKTIISKEKVIMSEIDDLKAAVIDEQAAIVQLTTDVDAAIAKLTTPGISPAEVESAALAIATANQSIRDSAKKIETALSPAPPVG